jgi:hypothetical protein
MYGIIKLENFNRDFYLSVILLLLAFSSRIYGISDWSFVGDEYPTVRYAAERIYSLINPAYYVLVLGSFGLFGVTEWSARLPAFLLGVASVPVFYLTWRNIVSQNTAFIGALLIIFSGWHLFYSQYSRFYTGVFLFGSLAYFFYYRAVQSDSIKLLFWGVGANLVAILFHITSALIAASFAVFCAIILLIKPNTNPNFSKRIAIIFLAATVIGGLILMPLLWDKLIARGQLIVGFGNPMKLVLQFVADTQLPIALTSLFGLFLLIKNDKLKGGFFALGIGIPLLIIIVCSIIAAVSSRYIFYTLPLVLILSAYFCDQIQQILKNHYKNTLIPHLLTILVIACLLPQTVSHYVGRNSLNFREVVSFIENNYQPGDRILSYVQGGEYGFNRYANRNYVLEKRYGGNPYRKSVDWENILNNYDNKRHRMWIILNIWRRPLVNKFETWLMANASLVWRKHETRYDEHIQGYEIWLMNGNLQNQGKNFGNTNAANFNFSELH